MVIGVLRRNTMRNKFQISGVRQNITMFRQISQKKKVEESIAIKYIISLKLEYRYLRLEQIPEAS